jgi:hypothetical protein
MWPTDLAVCDAPQLKFSGSWRIPTPVGPSSEFLNATIQRFNH